MSDDRRLFYWSLTSALAGFLFGFDTVVISGAEQTIQHLWNLSAGVHGIAMGAALYGTVLGSLAGSWPADRFGRRPTLLAIGVLFLASAIGSALAPNVTFFVAARFVGGLGIGVSTVAAPMYISEIAPPERRGRLAALFQFNIVLGIVIASTMLNRSEEHTSELQSRFDLVCRLLLEKKKKRKNKKIDYV